MSDLNAKIENTIGLLVSLLVSLEENKKPKGELHPLSLQILCLIAYFPACSLTPHAFHAFTSALTLLHPYP
jgi:hypothetical protein